MVVDLTDPNRPRFTLQELRDVLQERNKLKSQLLVVQEELQCYKRWGWAAPGTPAPPGWLCPQLLDTLCLCPSVCVASLWRPAWCQALFLAPGYSSK